MESTDCFKRMIMAPDDNCAGAKTKRFIAVTLAPGIIAATFLADTDCEHQVRPVDTPYGAATRHD